MPKPKLASLTDAQRHSLAKRHLSGHMLTDLEGFAGLDLKQLRTLFQSDRMRRVIGEEQEHLDTTASRIRNRMSYGIEDSVDRMKARGNGVDGPQIAFQADKFLIENLLPKNDRVILESHNTHHVTAEIAVQISDAITTLKDITDRTKGNGQSDLHKYTLLGTEGIATAEPSDTRHELVVEAPDGSGQPQEQSRGQPEPQSDD